jgi:hypothetical protein
MQNQINIDKTFQALNQILGQALPQQLNPMMDDIGQLVLHKSNNNIPNDYKKDIIPAGNYKVTTSNREGRVDVFYEDVEVQVGTEEIEDEETGKVSVTYIHEDLTVLYEQGGMAKFLERAAKDAIPDIRKISEEYIKRTY